MKYMPFGTACRKGNSEICAKVSLSMSSPCARSLSMISVILRVFQVQERIGDQAQATGLVHDLLVSPRRKFALVGKENPARQLMAVFALVELELHSLPQVTIREIAQDVLRFDDTAQVGKGLRQPVGRKAVG